MSPTGGTLYEREILKDDSATLHRHYLGNMIGAFVIEVYKTSRQDNRQYFLKDHLGSIDVVMNNYSNGSKPAERLRFDPFGKRRLATDWKESSDIVASSTSRGFTGHELLDGVGLIHMNGRLYDPQLARFTSADPNIDGATSVQGYNRYTYVHNNPLAAADPTGFFKWSKFRDKWVKPIAAIAISVASGGTLAGAMFGGFMSSLIMSGGDLKSAFIGAFTAALFFGVGTYFEGLANAQCAGLSAPRFAGKVLAHGTVGGVSSKVQGGEFRDGFRSAAFTQAFAPIIDKVPGSDFVAKATRITIAAIVGGTASELGGGKFENGAMTEAFSRAFNDESHWEFLEAGLATAGDRAWDGALAMGKVASGMAMMSVGAGMVSSGVGVPLGAILVGNGISNVMGGAGDWSNVTFGTNVNANPVELVASDLSVALAGQDFGKQIAFSIDVLLSGATMLAPRVPVILTSRSVPTAVGYGYRSEAAVGSRIPLANDAVQIGNGLLEAREGN